MKTKRIKAWIRLFGMFLLSLGLVSCGAQPTQTTANQFPDSTSCSSCQTYQNPTMTLGSFTINAWPSLTVNTGQTISLTPVSSVSDAVYTWTQTSPLGPYVTLTDAGNGAVNVTSAQALTAIIEVVETSSSDPSVYVYTDVTVQFGGGSTTGGGAVPTNTPLYCTLSHTPATYYVGSTVYFQITTSTGESVEVTSWDPGEAGLVTTLPLMPPLAGSYSSAGYKYNYIVAESISRPGVYCNNGQALTDTVYINPLSTWWW